MSQRLIIRVKPRTLRNRILGWEKPSVEPTAVRNGRATQAVLCVSVTAPATDGLANKMLLEFIATTLGIPKTSIRLTAGKTTRIKRLELPDSADLSRLES